MQPSYLWGEEEAENGEVGRGGRGQEASWLVRFTTGHTYLKAITKIDVQQLARISVQHEVGGMSIAKAQQVADHAHHSRAARVPCSPLQPHLTVAALQPQHLVQVLSCRPESKHGLLLGKKGVTREVRCNHTTMLRSLLQAEHMLPGCSLTLIEYTQSLRHKAS